MANSDTSLSKPPTSTAGFWLLLLALYGIAWYLQTLLVANSDASWLMLAAQRLWAGGSYGKDFFEINPPLIFYLYGPAVFLLKIFSWPSTLALRTTVFLLGSFSLAFCFLITKKIFALAAATIRSIFLLAIPIIFFILPLNEFGQREQFLIVLSLPYFLLTAARLQNISVTTRLAVTCGVMAGLGFAIKPYFLLAPVMVEGFYLVRTKRPGASVRSENLAIAAVIVSYVMLVCLHHWDYLQTVIPLLTHYYYQRISLPMSVMFTSEQAFFTYFAGCFYLLEYRRNAYRSLSTVLLAAALGFLLALGLQRTLWFYHQLPALAFDLLLFTLLFAQRLKRPELTLAEFIQTALFALAIFVYLYLRVDIITLSIFNYPAAYFALFGFVFSLVLYFYPAKKNNLLALLSVGLILLVCGLFYGNALYTQLQPHIFLLTTCLALLGLSLFLPRKRLHYLYLALLGMLIFAIPFQITGFIWMSASGYKKIYANLETLLRQYPHQSIYLITSASEFSFPAFENTHHPFISRFSGLFGWLPPTPAVTTAGYYQKAYAEKKSFYDYYLDALAVDLQQGKPDYIFIDTRNNIPGETRRYFGGYQIDYRTFFAGDDKMQHILQHYTYLKTADGQPFYRFEIYIKNS
jgi:hypothetical protein